MKEREWSRAAVCALASFIPAAVMLWTYASLGMAPWGDRTVLLSDMSSQYVEFFCALKSGDLFFSWSKALGTGYIGVFSYYVSSPLSFLTMLAPNEAMPIALMLLIVLKVGLAGASFALFAQRRFPGHGGAALICAVCYALTSYGMIYSICVMWLDGVIWLPLILLALERVLAGKGAGPFIAALTVCFFSTWYISYMAGAFCALYLCARLAALRPAWAELKKILLRFFGGAACALGLTAWLWLPTFLAMFTGKFSGGNVDYDGLLACGPMELLGQLLPGQYGGIGYSAPPYLFCGTAALALAAAYFALQAPLREKLANGAVLAALTASLLLSPLDKAWHLFQRPNWFPFRYSFVWSFFLLYLAVQVLGTLLDWLGERGPWLSRGAALVLAAFTVLELAGNAKSILGGLEGQFRSASYREYQDYYTANAALVEAAREDAGEAFFRMGAVEDRGHNSPLSFGYPGITHYSSLYNADVNQMTKKLGFAQSWMWCAYYGSTPATDLLLGVRYVVSRDEVPGYEPLAQAGELTLWKAPKTLPLAFMAVGGGVPDLGESRGFVRQNGLISGLTQASTSVFTPAEALAEPEGAEATVFTFTGTGKPVYADLSDSGLKEVLVNGEHLLWLGSSEAASIHCLGTPAEGEEWTVTVRHGPGWIGLLWELDQDALYALAERLDGAEVLSVEKDGRVRLTVSAAAEGYGQYLLTTIPAEKGWTAYVDGERSGTGLWLDAFLLVPLPAGEHQVELRYTAPGLVPGAALGALSAAALAAIGLSKRKRR